ncbi:MAG: hypothetical protein BGO89_13080 [Candidatus Kapaibacterium thiocyanatum]|uniref:Uncharacterized protein n=1 Tax=Candidatus Kapaibacterium thiocyanatum TaxID=1895771 RepID=A0A1M3KVL6_9BACT|nr:MAG: hypothetical protein BGO89_13080 ['Candidatus Kapabacteria' thiocyanatum]
MDIRMAIHGRTTSILILLLWAGMAAGCSFLVRSYVVNHGDTPAVIEVRMMDPVDVDSMLTAIRIAQGTYTIEAIDDTLAWISPDTERIDSTAFRVTVPPRSTAVMWKAFNTRGVRSMTMGTCNLLPGTCSRNERSGGFAKIHKYVVHIGEGR